MTGESLVFKIKIRINYKQKDKLADGLSWSKIIESQYNFHQWSVVYTFSLPLDWKDWFAGVGSGWDQGVVPAELQPRGTQTSFNEAGNLNIDSQASSINVTALVGKKAILGCVVRNINNHSVSITQLDRYSIDHFISIFLVA